MNSKMKTKEDQLFWKQAYYSIHPTLQETGIGMGGFQKPLGVELNVDVGDFAKYEDAHNNSLTVEVIKYVGERPWWKGHLFVEDEGHCWVVRSQSEPFEVHYNDGAVRFMDSMPVPDHMLEKVD